MIFAYLATLSLSSGLGHLIQAPHPQSQPEPQTPLSRNWSVNDKGTLFWDGQVYLPVGLRVESTPEAIQIAQRNGVKDLLVELPLSGQTWEKTIHTLEAGGSRYFLSINSSAAPAVGVAVEPEGYRVVGIKEPRKLDLSLPSASEALVMLVMQRDSSIAWSKKMPVENGRLKLDIDPQSEYEHILLIYPVLKELKVPDFWGGFDVQRDQLILSLPKLKGAKGCRGLVNPMGSAPRFIEENTHFVPTNRYFRIELEAALKQKYLSLKTAMQAWSLSSNDLSTFAGLARLVPLWTTSRGIARLWDPETDQLYTCDKSKSLVWTDIQDTLRASATRRYSRLVSAVRSITGLPVFQDWRGWAGPYESESAGLDGVGAHLDASTPISLVESAARPVSTWMRASRLGALLATQIDLPPGASEVDIENNLVDLASMGLRGWFFRTSIPGQQAAVGVLAEKYSLDKSYAEWKPKALFYPEAARWPAAPMQLSGGLWWLPSPAAGNRVDLGSRYGAYRYKDRSSSYVAIWSQGEKRRTKLRMTNPKAAVLMSLDGLDPATKVHKNALEVTLGNVPLLLMESDEVPVPEDVLVETTSRFDQIFKEAERRIWDIGEFRFFYRDALAGFDRNPGGSIIALRSLLQRLDTRYGDVLWIEAENSKEHNFSEVSTQFGCSGSTVLSLRSALPSSLGGYTSNYRVNVRQEAEYEIWVAARLAQDGAKSLTVQVHDVKLLAIEGPLSLYSSGFGWYRFGSIPLRKGQAQVVLSLQAPHGLDVAIDTLVLSPKAFRPQGVSVPPCLPPLPVKS